MPISPYMIAGNLNIGGGGGNLIGAASGMFGGNDSVASALGSSYQSAYNAALSQNQQNYSNILAGYQGLSNQQQQNQQSIQQGYGQLQNQVLGDIRGIDASQRQAINDVYAQQSGSAAQGLINRGLGNTTVVNSVQRGIDLDRAKANVALSNQTAQLTAGYRSNLGMAGLNYQNQANMQNTALGGQQLDWMNSVTSKYPDPNAYYGLMQQRGAAIQAQRGQGAMGIANMHGVGGGGGFTVGNWNSGPDLGARSRAVYSQMGGWGGGAGGGGSNVGYGSGGYANPYGIGGGADYAGAAQDAGQSGIDWNNLDMGYSGGATQDSGWGGGGADWGQDNSGWE